MPFAVWLRIRAVRNRAMKTVRITENAMDRLKRGALLSSARYSGGSDARYSGVKTDIVTKSAGSGGEQEAHLRRRLRARRPSP